MSHRLAVESPHPGAWPAAALRERWHTERVRIAAALIVGGTLVALGAAPAAASEGSVPIEVSTFVAASDGLVASLDDFFGVGSNGKGFDFDDTTTMGEVDRVFVFAPSWLADGTGATAVELSNEWTVPVSIADKSVGLAIVWINPSTVRPELADFVPDPDFGAALAGVPDGTYVVHDAPRDAWFLLAPPALTPVLSGTSGVSGPTTLTVYQGLLARSEPVASEPGLNPGSVLSFGIITAVALIVILVLLVPLARRRGAEPAGESDAAAAAAPDEN